MYKGKQHQGKEVLYIVSSINSTHSRISGKKNATAPDRYAKKDVFDVTKMRNVP